MNVFSNRDLEFWETNGYIILENAVPQENLDATINAIWSHLKMDPNKPDSWYSNKNSPKGFVELYHHQALWNNRQYPRIYYAFCELLNETQLWCSIDRVNMKPPSRDNSQQEGFIHWDFDSRIRPIPFVLQGVLCLTDTSIGQGGFQCVPGFHKKLIDWCEKQPVDRDPFIPNLDGLSIKEIPGKAGDLIIWHQALPHGNTPNTANRPRLAQYITMFPARIEDRYETQLRIKAWREKLPIKFWKYVQGQPLSEAEIQLRAENFPQAELSDLGKKLLGLEGW
jgi:ectoine hydroxylase-related dioxygenase (phytanoyl-CoA dioxygenase family)